MKHSTWYRMAFLMLVAAGALVTARPALANPIVPFTLAFEDEGLDLDTGTIVPIERWTLAVESADPQPDLVLGYNSERAVCAVVFHNRMNGVEIALLDGVAFNLVDSADLAGLSFTTAMIDEPFETGDSIVLRTDTGAHYLLGNPIEDASGVTFDTQLLDETTAGLARPAMDGLRLARGNVQHREAPTSASPSLPPGLSTGDWRQIRGLVEEDGYRFQPVSEVPQTFTASNAAHELRATLDGSGFRLSSSTDDDWDWGLTLLAYGYAGELRPAETGKLAAQGNRLEHRRGDLIEWYVNDGGGLEQGFTLAARPAGEWEGPLFLTLTSSGSLSPMVDDGLSIRLMDAAGRTVLRYAGLLAWDATGRELPARLAARADELTIEVDDANAVYPVTIDPTVVHEDAKLTASDAQVNDLFGGSVAISGDTVVVGAERKDQPGHLNAGSAYVFVRSGTEWFEQAKLTASDPSFDDRFGSSVAISGETVVVGAYGNDHVGGTNAGSAYVFDRSGTEWSEHTKLIASDAAARDGFGYSLAVSGETVVVGAIRDVHSGGVEGGSAYVFVRNGTTWAEQAKLIASDSAHFDRFGISVALEGDTAVVGAFLDDHSGVPDAGAAYVMERTGSSWTEQAKLTASDPGYGDWFGDAVTLSGDTAMVGAFGDDAGGINAGAAYVFVRNGSSWTELVKLMESDAANYRGFGNAVALEGDIALAGSRVRGAAYVFVRGGTSWSEQAKLTASDAASSDTFGDSVALEGGTAVVGAGFDDHVGGTNAGSAYVFQLVLNEPPVALCMNVTAAVGPNCTADTSIDSGSFDPDGDPITLSQDPPGPYGLGDTLATLTVTDDQGASASCTATVTVADTTAPQLSVVLTPDTLWPPNHHMVDVEAAVTASDNCGPPTIALVSLTSNEADDAQGKGDGKTIGDIQPGADDFHFSLRAERAGTGSGRIYTAVYTATDGSGNAASEAGFVVVPHDKSGMVDPVAIALEQNAGGTLVFWPAVSGAESYDVIRGELNNVEATGVVINLDAVVCIEANSVDESTLGWEDSVLPNPGQAFFYVVEYDNGASSTYGAESAGMSRAPGPGDCQ